MRYLKPMLVTAALFSLNGLAVLGMARQSLSVTLVSQIVLGAATVLTVLVLLDTRAVNRAAVRTGLVVLSGGIAELVLVRELATARMPDYQLPFVVTTLLAALWMGTRALWRAGLWVMRRWQDEPRSILIPLAVVGAVVVDVLLVVFFNTLAWPYLFPRPLMFVVFTVLVALIAVPELSRGTRTIRLAGAAMLYVGQCYLLHIYTLLYDDVSLLGLMHAVGVTGMFLVIGLNFINQSRPKKNHGPAPLLPGVELPFVVAVVPTYGESLDILERTLVTLKRLHYPEDRLAIIVSDDMHREDLRQLAAQLGIHYNFGTLKDAKAGNLNSALDYITRGFPHASLILTQDADEIIHPDFLLKTVGYFQRNPKLGFVQTPKEAYAPPNDPFGTRDRFFYDVTQIGRNGYGAAFACGSGVLWSLEAIRSIGGFATWNVVEDLTTSYFIHSAGYESEYHPEILSIGLAPEDIPGLLKQRGTWAVDNWRLFLFDNALFKKGQLSLGQRLQYLELGLFYVTTAFITPLVMMIPIISILTGHYLFIEGAALFPWVVATIVYYFVLGSGKTADVVRMWQFWVGHGPTFIRAFFIAVKSRHEKPGYVVTRKDRQYGFYGHLLWPQFVYLALAVAALAYVVISPPQIPLSILLSNVGTVLFFAYLVSAICRASFYGVNLAPFSNLNRGVRLLVRQFATVFQGPGNSLSRDTH